MKTISDYQKKVVETEKKFDFEWPLYVRFIHLVEEIGELGEAITVKEGDRKVGSGEKALADHADLEEEFGDALFALFDLANKMGIDLSKSFDKTFERYEGKLLKYRENIDLRNIPKIEKELREIRNKIKYDN